MCNIPTGENLETVKPFIYIKERKRLLGIARKWKATSYSLVTIDIHK